MYMVVQSQLTLSDGEYFLQEKDEMKYTIKYCWEANLMFVLIKIVHLVGNKWCLLIHQFYLQSKQFIMYLLLLINKIKGGLLQLQCIVLNDSQNY
jgi:hypothetical protein